MPQYLILIVVSAVLVIFGIAFLFWGRNEEKRYYDAIATREDAREYLEHEPQHPEPGALKIGGWLGLAIGLVMFLMGIGFWLWG